MGELLSTAWYLKAVYSRKLVCQPEGDLPASTHIISTLIDGKVEMAMKGEKIDERNHEGCGG
jgi:hypothetical protein